MSDKKMMQIRIEGDLHKWLKLYAAKNDITMTDIIIQYLEYLRRKSAKAVSVEQI
jgi:predicted HicB family RNase H-like nuclease